VAPVTDFLVGDLANEGMARGTFVQILRTHDELFRTTRDFLMKKSHLIPLAEAEEMISNSFPALRGMTIRLKVLQTGKHVMAVCVEGKEIHLDVSRDDIARMQRRAVIGVLAHELCHAEEDHRYGPVLEGLFDSLCEYFPGLETRRERRMDMAVIRKGYGNELLAFQRYHDRHYKSYKQTDGLTIKEIEVALHHTIPRDTQKRYQSFGRNVGNLAARARRAVRAKRENSELTEQEPKASQKTTRLRKRH
jgi:hypothetical protein